jgi:hypothetical protein
MNGMLATILNPEQQRDLVEALQVAIDDLNDRVLVDPNVTDGWEPEDFTAASAKADRYVALINLLQKES